MLKRKSSNMGNVELVAVTIPIYTKKNPHPTRKRKADCPIEVQYKQGLRQSMLLELRLGGNKDAIIQKYQMKVSEI